jgi:uncharacterized membrane protein
MSEKLEKTLMAIGFTVALVAILANLVWDYFGMNSPFWYNIPIGLIMTTYAYIHGRRYFGAFRINTLFVLTFVISFIMEHLGVSTGLPFGSYFYGDLHGPKVLGTVPVLIPFSWFMFLYPAVIISNELLDGWRPLKDLLEGRPGIVRTVIYALTDSIVLTSLDIIIDPVWVFRGAWTWTETGSIAPGQLFYGIPVLNYFGWLFTSFIIFIIFRSIFFGRESKAGKDTHYYLIVMNFIVAFIVGCIESWVLLKNTGVIFVSIMVHGLISLLFLSRFSHFLKKE